MINYREFCMGCMEIKGTLTRCPKCGWVEGTQTESSLHLPPFTFLQSKYLLGRVLGHGGFGITYLAWDLTLNVKLAIKEYMPQAMVTRPPGHSEVSIYKETYSDEYKQGLNKFLQEARTLAQFAGHPNIVSVRDFFMDNGTAYIVMNYIEGMTLRNYLEHTGSPVSFAEARELFMPLLDALEVIHAAQTLHRDISPDNLYLNNNNKLILIDFGAARRSVGENRLGLSVIMKAGFTPEEQCRSNGEQGPWTDIYSTAASIYWLITNQKPPESLDRLAEDTLIPPSQLGADIKMKEERALLKALSVHGAERYQTVREFKMAICADREADRDLGDSEKINLGDALKPDLNMNSYNQNKNLYGRKQFVEQPGRTSLTNQVLQLAAIGLAIILVIAITVLAWSKSDPDITIATSGDFVKEVPEPEITQNPAAGISVSEIPFQAGHEAPARNVILHVPGDYSTIQSAIGAATNGDLIIVAPGTYDENIDFLGKNIVLRSTDPENAGIVAATIINGGRNSSVVTIRSGENRNAVLEGFTITGGSGTVDEYKGVSYDGVKSDYRRRYGGGIIISGGSSPTISNNIVVNNYVRNLSRTDVGVGGGIAVLDNASPLIEGNTIRENSSEGHGGGIAVWYNSSPIIRNNIIEGNSSDDTAGGILISMMSSAEITANVIKRNSSKGAGGGGIYVAHLSGATITGNQIESNEATDGAGILVRQTDRHVYISDNLLANNKASQLGGAISVNSRDPKKVLTTATIVNNRIENNSARHKGGAIWVERGSLAKLSSPDSNSYRNNKPDNVYIE